MNSLDGLLKKPRSSVDETSKARFERFNLKENPFPSEPVVNKDAKDNRINGNIFEEEIRRQEYEKIKKYFLEIPRDDPNHLRMGFVMDTSYIGRGNGKSAFLINLHRKINKNLCMDISSDANKCFSVYLSPEAGGRTKTFDKFVDLLFSSLLSTDIIDQCLATIRLETILSSPLFKNNISKEEFESEDNLIENLNSADWIEKHKINVGSLNREVLKNKFLSDLPSEFPLYQAEGRLFQGGMVRQDAFKEYYFNLKRGQERFDFVFSRLVKFFLAANFNGAVILVDDFERIPDFQSARQKRDFALQLRSCLYDGLYTNAKIGFYTFILVLHAGVPRLLKDAWSDSGMENRVPISPTQTKLGHIVLFEKLNRNHAVLLVKRYLDEYRIKPQKNDDLSPFTEEAVYRIAEISELNASKILKLSYEYLDIASKNEEQKIIDKKFIEINTNREILEKKQEKSIADTQTVDLYKKAKEDD